MMTHAEVHEEVERICSGTRLTNFTVTTQSIRSEDGSVTVEWGCVISSGRAPEFYYRSRSPNELVSRVAAGVHARRPYFAMVSESLNTLRTEPPKDAPPSAGACRCQQIMSEDSLRHFKGCPLRQALPDGHPAADTFATTARPEAP